MNRAISIVVFWILLGSSAAALAGDPKDFPELVNADIPGAPKLGKPILIMGTTGPVKSEGWGWAAPAVWDWDGDGKQDLLIGEFGTGVENGAGVGSFIRVYTNIGSTNAPEFSDKFQYLHYAKKHSSGAPISTRQFCCHGFTPQFVDLDNDGRKDLITGQYYPGDVTWFRNTEEGFQLGMKLEQAGDPGGKKENGLSDSDPQSVGYWSYSSASFGDFDGDGDYDLITGGDRLRISENIGSKTEPKFGFRKPLLDTNGKTLRVSHPTEEERKKEWLEADSAGDSTVPLVVDWDQDGVLDLLVTGAYLQKRQQAVTFFRGVKTGKDHRFEPGIALFKRKWRSDKKAFPGSWLRVYVTDWNSDGVNDLLIGASVAIVKGGEFEHDLSWRWEDETGITKLNPGFPHAHETLASARKELRGAEMLVKRDPKNQYRLEQVKERRKYLLNGGDPSLVHQGYVYVMLGEKR